jgi:hypothetical protein
VPLHQKADHLFDDGLDRFGLGQSGGHAVFFDHAGGQVAQQRPAVSRIAPQFVSILGMSHVASPP